MTSVYFARYCSLNQSWLQSIIHSMIQLQKSFFKLGHLALLIEYFPYEDIPFSFQTKYMLRSLWNQSDENFNSIRLIALKVSTLREILIFEDIVTHHSTSFYMNWNIENDFVFFRQSISNLVVSWQRHKYISLTVFIVVCNETVPGTSEYLWNVGH